MKIKLIDMTDKPVEKIYKSYRICYSKNSFEEVKVPVKVIGTQAHTVDGSFFEIKVTDTQKMIDFIVPLMEEMHSSPLEQVQFSFSIEGLSRAAMAQLTRHRTFKFNCVSGDTVLYRGSHKLKKTTIKDFFELTKQYRDMSTIRCLNEETKELVQTKVLNVWKTGIKEVYEIEAKNGYKVKTTLDHRFLTENGWKQLKDIKIGDKVFTNGIEAYKDKEWLNNKYNIEKYTQEEIGKMCNVSKHTIRSWVRKYKLQKEAGSWGIGRIPPNKGKTKENYEPLRISSEKLKGNTHYKNREYTNLYDDISQMSLGGKRERAVRDFERTGKCELCGSTSRDIHHLDRNLNNIEKDNLIELCTKCHKIQHHGASVKVVQLMEVTNIKYIGEEEVFDIEVEHKDHNFVGNGFILHNCQSQRYVDANNFSFVMPDLQYIKNEKEKEMLKKTFNNIMQQQFEAYNQMLTLGVKKEDARGILGQATTCNLVVSMDLNNFRNFLRQRLCAHAQSEIRELAREMNRLVKEQIPFVDHKVLLCQQGLCKNNCK